MKMAVQGRLLKRAHGPAGISVFDIIQDGQTSLDNWVESVLVSEV